MDKKDSIILQQLEVIRSMTENNLKRMDNDFWGTPFANVGKSDAPAAPGSGEARKDQPPTSDGNEKEPEVREEELPPEPIEDLLAELDSYIGLEAIKEEVRNLIKVGRAIVDTDYFHLRNYITDPVEKE